MARNGVFVEAPPAKVFEVLADAPGYSRWVVGTHEVRHADGHWPKAGAAFGYTAGLPPLLTLKDETVVLESEPPSRLVLEIRARPLPNARVCFQLEPRDGGTQLTMVEDMANPVLNMLAGPAFHAAVRIRNWETLRRLKSVAEHPA
ncbi:MAG TPA: SRPBCC family protein [Solirubrobacteraceae bacterium]|jgi:uncharacterized protein YndB with AHSA1/START domain|nr:SRPBCC family protein [Solirubrobacteraceae bacterium]